MGGQGFVDDGHDHKGGGGKRKFRQADRNIMKLGGHFPEAPIIPADRQKDDPHDAV